MDKMNRKSIIEFMSILENLFLSSSIRRTEIINIKREITERYGYLLKNGDLDIRSSFSQVNNGVFRKG